MFFLIFDSLRFVVPMPARVLIQTSESFAFILLEFLVVKAIWCCLYPFRLALTCGGEAHRKMHLDGMDTEKKENNNKSMECIIMKVFWRRPHQYTTRTNQMGSLMTIVMMTETTNDDRRDSFFLAALVSDIKWQSLNAVSVCEASLLPAHLHRAIVWSTKWVWLSEWLSYITFIWICLCFLWGLSSLIQPPYLFDSGGFALKMCPLYLNLLSGCTWTK